MDTAAKTTEVAGWWRSPLVWAAACWMVGLVLGRELGGGVWAWVAAASVAIVICGAALWRAGRGRELAAAGGTRLAIVAAAVAIVSAAAAWWEVRVVDDAAMVPVDESRLVEVEGAVLREPTHRVEASGEMGRFDYRGPATTLWLEVDRVAVESPGLVTRDGGDDGGLRSVALLVSLLEYDDRFRPGDRVRIRGWLTGFRRPDNPGERDFRRIMRERGVIGRVTVGGRGNIDLLATVEESSGAAALVGRTLERTRGGAERALRHGLPIADEHAAAEPIDAEDAAPADERHLEALGLLEALLIGRRGGDMEELEDVFARTGLTHLLAISGLHLGILVIGVWWVVLAVTGRPRWALAAAGLAVLVYVAIVPARVPVLRAGVMTFAAMAAIGFGRRLSAMATMSAAALLLLIWRPWDLFAAGFQLSFLVVAALVLYARAMSAWMLPQPLLRTAGSGRFALRRYGVDYVAVSFVAWCTAMPLVAWHFGRVSPFAIAGAVLMLPVVAGVLYLGYVKMMLTALWPAVGQWLGVPLWWLAEGAVIAVRWAAELPVATLELGSVSGWWTVMTLAVAWSAMGGAFAGRRLTLGACVLLLGAWLSVTAGPGAAWLARSPLGAGGSGVRVNMFSVGHGTAMLIRSGGEAWMYDCGSGDHLDITTAAVAPALDALGVPRIDTLVISHADLDHISGVIELVDRYRVRRVLLPEQFVERAEAKTWGADRYVLEAIRERSITIEQPTAGWRERLGDVEVEVIWPFAGERFDRGNDGSLVLSLETAGRRILLPGDIEHEGMAAMLERGVDVRADVVEFPHHGAWADAGLEWLRAANPRVLIQSTSDRRLRHDRWGELLPGGVERHITARHGMIEIEVDTDGHIHRRRFRDDATRGQ